MRRWLVLAAVVVVLDQVSKLLALSLLSFHRPVPVLPMFDLTLTANPGAAFSLLGDASGWQRWFFSAISVLISAIIVLWLRRMPRDRFWLPCGLALVLGGALGNLVDRLARGVVIDFIDVYYGRWHWPAFNIADSAITVGAVLVVLSTLREGARHAD